MITTFPRRWSLARTLALLVLAATTATAQPPAAPAPSGGTSGQPDVDAIVARNIAARGGAEKLKSLQTVEMTGTATLQGTAVTMKLFEKRPRMMRQELAINGTTIVQAYDGTTAWVVNPMFGSDEPHVLPPAQTATMRDQADFEGTLTDYKAKGYSVELVGKEQIDGKDAYHLRVTRQQGSPPQDYYLDAETGRDLRVSTTVQDPSGQPAVIRTDLSDYRQVDGVTVPFKMVQSVNGRTLSEMTVEKVQFNLPIADSLFRMPEKK